MELIISGFRWIDLFSPTQPDVKESLLDTLAADLQTKMGYNRNEKDLVVLQHKFVIEWADGKMVRTWSDGAHLVNSWTNCKSRRRGLPP